MKTPEEIREAENKSIIERLRRGESITRINASATWFPPRPVIKKDEKALNFVFSKDKEDDTNGIVDKDKSTGRLSMVHDCD